MLPWPGSHRRSSSVLRFGKLSCAMLWNAWPLTSSKKLGLASYTKRATSAADAGLPDRPDVDDDVDDDDNDDDASHA
jgi:hypothetical protein